MEALILVLLALNLLTGLIALLVLLRKRGGEDLAPRLDGIQSGLDSISRLIREETQASRAELGSLNAEQRKELSQSILALSDSLKSENRGNREELSAAQNNLSETLSRRMKELSDAQQTSLGTLREQINKDSLSNREELANALNNLSESLTRRMQDLSITQQTSFDALRDSLNARMEQIRENNEKKLEEMRRTVDEKLHETLEKRLGEHFNQVSERLELVHKGLGEMQILAKGVGDLKKVLSNVKTRGVMGELQLESILEQMLTQEQYEKNYRPNRRRDETVEFAVRLPGRDEQQESVYLPIDSKFPVDMYHHLVEAYETAEPALIDTARKKLYTALRSFAKDIRDKYINPPNTTDFALLFLPFEGLYAEVIRDADLFENLRRQYQVVIVGPTTISALLNSLQMGFRTLAIEKRSGEVWKILGAVKNEFGKFGEVLEKTQKKLQEASNVIDTAHHRSRQIQKKLDKVQELPASEARAALEMDETAVLIEPDSEL